MIRDGFSLVGTERRPGLYYSKRPGCSCMCKPLTSSWDCVMATCFLLCLICSSTNAAFSRSLMEASCHCRHAERALCRGCGRVVGGGMLFGGGHRKVDAQSKYTRVTDATACRDESTRVRARAPFVRAVETKDTLIFEKASRRSGSGVFLRPLQ